MGNTFHLQAGTQLTRGDRWRVIGLPADRDHPLLIVQPITHLHAGLHWYSDPASILDPSPLKISALAVLNYLTVLTFYCTGAGFFDVAQCV